jgi:hypothetical protein
MIKSVSKPDRLWSTLIYSLSTCLHAIIYTFINVHGCTLRSNDANNVPLYRSFKTDYALTRWCHRNTAFTMRSVHNLQNLAHMQFLHAPLAALVRPVSRLVIPCRPMTAELRLQTVQFTDPWETEGFFMLSDPRQYALSVRRTRAPGKLSIVVCRV